MIKRMGIGLLVAVLVVSMNCISFAGTNGKGEEHRATPAISNGEGTRATPAIPWHRADDNNILSNSSFENDFSTNIPNEIGIVNTESSWIFYTNSGAEGSYDIDKKMLKITPISVNAPNYGIQLIQSPIKIERLGIYKVSFLAKAETERNITVKIGATGDKGWKAYKEQIVALTTDLNMYEFEFTMYDDTDEAARFEMFFAEDISVVWLDEIELTKIGEAEAPVTLEELLNRTKTEEDENMVEDWQLVWSDEFNSSEIDQNNWTFEIGNGADKGIPGWGNNELEYYTDSSENAYIENGSLIIQALEEEKTFTVNNTEYTTGYTSARMITEGKVSTTYGRIEASVKVPSDQGIWSAFWMLGQNIATVGWPQCGEIDILEYIGSNVSEIHGTVHGAVTAGAGINGHVDLGIDLSQDYHVYAIEWDEDEVEFYLDDVLYHIVNKDETAYEYGPEEWVYDHEHYLILNLAVGGNWPGAPDASTVFPNQMAVDYIRIYEDINPASIDGEEVIDTIYELEPETSSVDGFVNGTFDVDSEGWTSYIHYDAVGSFDVIAGEAVFALESDGNEDYSAHIYQGPFLFDGTKAYTVEFDARADISRDLLVVVDNAGYYRFVNEVLPLDSTMSTYSVTFTVPDEEATLKFLAGELGNNITGMNNIYIDNVKLFEVGANAEPTDNIIYDEGSNMIVDSAFQIWEQDEWSGPGAGTMTQSSGVLTIDVTSVGNSYSPQVFQDGLVFENGGEYLVRFDASSLVSKTINVNVGKALTTAPWWVGYVPTQTYVLDTQVNTYEFAFTMTEESYDNGKIVFELGTVNGDATTTVVNISNIKILKGEKVTQ